MLSFASGNTTRCVSPRDASCEGTRVDIATGCGEEGRACFHRICTFHHDYEYARADKFFTNLLRCNRGSVTLGTAFHLAKRAGVTVAHQGAVCRGAATPHTQARVREEEDTETEDSATEEMQSGRERANLQQPENLKDGIIAAYDFMLGDDDFMAVMSLAEPLYRHTTHILSFLPDTDVSRRDNVDADTLFLSLPPSFTWQQYFAAAEALEVKSNTARSWLRRAVRRGVVERDKENGIYVSLACAHACV